MLTFDTLHFHLMANWLMIVYVEFIYLFLKRKAAFCRKYKPLLIYSYLNKFL